MPGSIFGIALRPTSGQGVIWSETLGGRMDVGADSQPASQITGLTLNRVPFGNSLGGLQDSANLTFDGTTLTLAGAATVGTTLGVTGTSTLAGLNATSIGATTRGTGLFTTLGANGAVTFTSTLAVSGTGSFGDTLTVSKDQAGAYTHFDVVNPNAGGYAQTNLTAQGKTAGTNWAPGLFYKFTTPTSDPIVFEVNGVEVVRFTTSGLTIASGDALTLGNAYVATPTVGTGYVTIKDSAGTTYKVLVAT